MTKLGVSIPILAIAVSSIVGAFVALGNNVGYAEIVGSRTTATLPTPEPKKPVNNYVWCIIGEAITPGSTKTAKCSTSRSPEFGNNKTTVPSGTILHLMDIQVVPGYPAPQQSVRMVVDVSAANPNNPNTYPTNCLTVFKYSMETIDMHFTSPFCSVPSGHTVLSKNQDASQHNVHVLMLGYLESTT